MNTIPTQNFFSNLGVQEQQETGNKETEHNNEIQQKQGVNNSSTATKRNNTNNEQKQQATADHKHKTPHSMLPKHRTPNIINVTAVFSEEVCGGMDGGCQEIASNLQDGVTKGGKLPHVMHEGLEYDLSTDHRASNKAKNRLQQGKQQQLQQQVQNRDNTKQSAKENNEKQQNEKTNEKDQGKQSVTIATENILRVRISQANKKKDVEKRRQNRLQERDKDYEQDERKESYNKFIMVDDNHVLDILPLQAQYMTPPTYDPPDIRQQKGKLNNVPILDEYVVDNSEDEMDGDNHSIEEVEEDDDISEALIRAFSPHNDQTLEEEIQQVTQSQCLSPRGLHHEKFHFKKQYANTVTTGRPNTRLFSSRSSH